MGKESPNHTLECHRETVLRLFKSKKGNVAKPLRLGLGALIQAEYGFSDVEVTLQIQETAYLQYFCGYKVYDDSKPPFDPSLMVYFRKRLTPEILGEINEMILAAQNADKSYKDDENAGNDVKVRGKAKAAVAGGRVLLTVVR